MDRAVARSFDILEALAHRREPVRLSDVAAATGLSKSTAHRILGTLCALGYAEQRGAGLYGASLRLWELGMGLVADLPINRVAAGFLQGLHRATGETVSLSVLAGDDVLYLEKITAPRPVRFRTRPGSRVPAPMTAGGKAMLALRPDAEAALARVAERQAFDLDAVRGELEAARRRGYAISVYSPGVTSFGAAVASGAEPPTAALSVSAPTDRLDEARREAIVQALLETAARLAEALDRP